MKKLLVWTFISIVLLANMSVAATTGKLGRESAEDLTEQLKALEERISEARKQAERIYTYQLKNLKLRVNQKIKLLEETERANLAKIEDMKKNRFFMEHKFFPLDGLLSKEEIDSAEKNTAEKKKAILAKMELDIQKMDRQKKYALTSHIPYLEAQLKERLLKPKPEPLLGTVTGIVHGIKTQFALINHKIVKTGDVLYGVKILKIFKREVEFEKNGKIWKQRPGGSPEKYPWSL